MTQPTITMNDVDAALARAQLIVPADERAQLYEGAALLGPLIERLRHFPSSLPEREEMKGRVRAPSRAQSGAVATVTDDLAYLSIAEAARRIAARQLSPVELTRALLARIARVDPKLGSYVTLDAERALAAARAAETEIATGRYRGALHGIPIALKDAYDTAGVRTTVGSRLFEDNVPTSDAHAWAKLKNAGAILLGKLETTELCYGGPSPDGLFPACKNPWDLSCYAGGSSSGAGVALAAGLCLGALGTDTGGSIRLPAAYCGITGLMASTGLVGGSGVFPLSHSLDHFGPMARSAEDCAILLNALVGIDPNDPRSVVSPVGDYRVQLDQPIKGLRVGLVAAMLDGAFTSADTIAATLAAAQILRGLGAVMSDAPFPDMFDFAACQLVITAAEAFALHEKALQQRRADFSYYTRTRISLAPLVRAVDYVEAKRVRRALNASYRDLIGAYDVLLLPGAPGPAPKAAQVGAFDFMKKPLVTMPANVLGCAAISLPAGFSATGLPLAIQLQGPRLGEATVLRAAHAFQMATDWHRARPEL